MSLLIDVHCHVSPLTFPPSPSEAARGRWPCMQCASPVDATILMGETPFRKLDHRSWDAPRRVEDMERDKVSLQVISPMPELLSYWLDAADAEVICDHVNHQIADMVAHDRKHFRGLGAVPLQAPERAAAALERCRTAFGLSGVEIGSNINGAMLGDPRFEPFFAAAEELGLAIFVHALHPVATKAINATQPFTAFAGFPIDVAMAAASLILAGTLERHPRLRIAFSHGGGTLGAMLGRLDVGWKATNGFGIEAKRRPSEQVRSMFFDSNVYDTEYLRHLVTHMAPGQVFVGTDYPYQIMQTDPGGFVDSLKLETKLANSLRQGAACAFLAEQIG
jgi:aminocarboxymuconate-semialdehyde decarboxylase